ncbi:11-beta-hydroxysteroid dehydrogenase 1 [Ranitomeya imitator]|uniref:11-beta-hydroxysteroid dehydrogenase 1 n=1 Tax=Ranitomeya imitator TaxID=111125 RepID=UPI0037E9BD9C
MAFLNKALIFLIGILLAVYFYSGKEFKPEMLKGKRVIVTGASSGIGEQMAYHLAKMGSHILITARTEEKLKKVVEKCTKLGAASASYLSGSMDSMTFAKSVVHEAERLFGGLDMLILNHIGYTYFNFFDGNVDHIRELMEINFLSYATMTVEALPMLKASGGNFVVVSSIAGKVGSPLTVPYTTTKFALDGFFSSLRMEFYQQKVNVSITLCVISYIDTDSAVNTVSNVIRQPAAPKEECALEIIKGGALRQREVYYQYQATKIPLLLRDWAPEFLDYLVLKNYDVSALNSKQE